MAVPRPSPQVGGFRPPPQGLKNCPSPIFLNSYECTLISPRASPKRMRYTSKSPRCVSFHCAVFIVVWLVYYSVISLFDSLSGFRCMPRYIFSGISSTAQQPGTADRGVFRPMGKPQYEPLFRFASLSEFNLQLDVTNQATF